jgi:serine/threonine-protein kinase HipA
MQADLSMSVENEWLCACILRAFGLPVADCRMASFEDQKVLIVTRFDRRLHDSGTWWLRLPQEDLCQATATPPGQRYEADGGPGIREIADVLLGSRTPESDRRGFFRAQVLYWMLCATDGHAKNFSVFIERLGRYTLTPFYDVLSAYPVLGTGRNQLAPQKARMAMAVTAKNRHYRWAEIQPRHWLATAGAVGLGATARDDISQLATNTDAVINEVSSSLPAGFPEKVSDSIFDGLAKAGRRLAEIG